MSFFRVTEALDERHLFITCHGAFDIAYIAILSLVRNDCSFDVFGRLANLFEFFHCAISLVIGSFPFIYTLFVRRLYLFFICIGVNCSGVGF